MRQVVRRFRLESQQFPRPLPEKYSFRCQRNLPVSTEKEFLAAFLLQVLELSGEGGLRQVKHFRRIGNASFLANREKIA